MSDPSHQRDADGPHTPVESTSSRSSSVDRSSQIEVSLADVRGIDLPPHAAGSPLLTEPVFEPVLRILASTLLASRVSLWLLDSDRLSYRCTGVVDDARSAEIPGPFELAADPSWFDQLQTARILVHDGRTEHPLSSRLQRTRPLPTAATTTCDAGVLCGHTVFGVLSLVRTKRKAASWSREESNLITTAADRCSFLFERLERSRLEAALESRDAQLVHAHRMYTLGLLAAGAAHDFNNSLTALCGHVQLIAETVSDEDARQRAQSALETIGHAAALAQQLVGFGGRSEHRHEPARLDEAATRVDRLLGSILGDRCELALEVEPDLGSINVSPVQLAQILVNLSMNARDAIGDADQGIIRISIKDHRPIDPDALGPGSYVSIRVTDNGPGMDAGTRDLVFEPGFTTKQSGSGLGLSSVRSMVERAGGTISVHSERGVGSTFEVILPRLGD